MAIMVLRVVQGDAPERIRAWRLARGLSQCEFAALVGCSQCTVSKIETGKSFPPEGVFDVIAKTCRIARTAWGGQPKRRRTRVEAQP